MFKAFVPSITLPAGKSDIRKGGGIGIICNGQTMLFDGFEGGEPTNGMKAWLAENDVSTVDVAVLSHIHYDHYNGLLQIEDDSRFHIKQVLMYDPLTLKHGCDGSANGRAVKDDMNNAYKFIRAMQAYGTKVNWIDKGGTVKCGDTSWKVYRNQPRKFTDLDDGNAYAFVNDGSLVLYSPEVQLLFGGDGCIDLKDAIAYFKQKIIAMYVQHHGNDCPESSARAAAQAGVILMWETNVERRGPGTTGFTMYGSRRVVQQGIPVWMQNEPIYITAANGKITFKQGSKTVTAKIPYEGKAEEGWVHNHKGWWYRLSDGGFAKGWRKCLWSKEKVKGSWFLFGDDGYMKTGWQKVNGKWYYLDPDTGAMKTGWIFVNGIWYYLEDSGAMHTGWMEWKDKKCYLDPANGHCLVNCTRVIDGKTYRFDKDGYATEESGGKSFLNGVDIASYQSSINPAKLTTTDFVIVKFTQGTTYLNPYADRQYSVAKAAGKLLGAYHYGTGKSATAEAQYFVKCLGNRVGECVLALDWEGNQNSVFGTGKDAAWCKEFLDEVYRLTGVRPLIYMSKSVCRKYNWSSVAAEYPLWCAQYKSNSTTDYQSSPWTDSMGFGAWQKDTIRQYSSHGRIAGYDSNIDIELAYLSAEEWRAMAGGKIQTEESPIDVAIQIAESYLGYHEGANNKTIFGDTMHAIQPSNMDANAPWCFTAGTMVLTSKGYKKIESIEIGDLVLNAYGNSFNVVHKIMSRESLVNEIRAYGTLKMRSTSDHPFLCNQRLGVRKDWKHTDVEFRPLNKISHGDNVVIPATNEFEDIKLTYDEAWSVGYFVGDGWKTSRGEYRICGNDAKEKEVLKHFVGIEKEKDYASRTCHEYRIRIDKNSNIVPLLDLAGIGAENKVVPAPILFANTETKKAFLDGYMTADGTKEGRFSTVSKALALGIVRLVFDIGYGCSIRECVRNENQIIYDSRINDYRPIKIKPIIYCGSINANPSKQRRMDRRDGNLIFVPVKYNNETGEKETVYNITVGGDHTYLANNLAVHNCDAFVDFVILKTCEHFGKGAETARMVLCGDFDDYTYNSVALYKKAGRWSNTPHRGDQIFFGGSGHTGIVTSVESGTVHTIEGNKGDEVRRGSYSVNSPSIIGYGRPKYDLITGKITAADMPLVKKGSKGDAVKKLQEILNGKGYKLTVDGDFGEKTDAAVRAYQKANHLEVDGEVGPKTWSSLFA